MCKYRSWRVLLIPCTTSGRMTHLLPLSTLFHFFRFSGPGFTWWSLSIIIGFQFMGNHNHESYSVREAVRIRESSVESGSSGQTSGKRRILSWDVKDKIELKNCSEQTANSRASDQLSGAQYSSGVDKVSVDRVLGWNFASRSFDWWTMHLVLAVQFCCWPSCAVELDAADVVGSCKNCLWHISKWDNLYDHAHYLLSWLDIGLEMSVWI